MPSTDLNTIDQHVKALRVALLSHGYTKSTIRSYAFYMKDFMGWMGARYASDRSDPKETILPDRLHGRTRQAESDLSESDPHASAGAQDHRLAVLLLTRAMVAYGVYLKEERKVAPSSVSQAMAAVSFFIRNVVERKGEMVLVGGLQGTALEVEPQGPDGPVIRRSDQSPDLTIIRSFLGPTYIDMSPKEPYSEAVKRSRKM